MKNYKKIILDISAMDCHIDNDYLYLINGRDEKEGYEVTRYRLDELRSWEDDVDLSALNTEVLTEFHEYPFSICVTGDFILLGMEEAFKVFNMKTKKMTTVSKMQVYDINVAGKYAYVSYGADGGLVRYSITEYGLESPEEQYAFSLSSYVLNDNVVLNEYRDDGVNFILFGCSLPVISMLSKAAKAVMDDGNRPIALCGKNKLFFLREKDDVMFKVNDYTSFRKVDSTEIVRLPVDLKKFFRGNSTPISHQGFGDGIIIEMYGNTGYIEEEDYLVLSSEPIMTFHANDENGIICVVGEDDVQLFIFE